jgi:Domain of unknown function (DUF2437)
MTQWIRFAENGAPGFGRLDGTRIAVHAGDVIACGTSIGVGSMKPGSAVAVAIDGIGTLANRFE